LRLSGAVMQVVEVIVGDIDVGAEETVGADGDTLGGGEGTAIVDECARADSEFAAGEGDQFGGDGGGDEMDPLADVDLAIVLQVDAATDTYIVAEAGGAAKLPAGGAGLARLAEQRRELAQIAPQEAAKLRATLGRRRG
jgi:hypothetical protein